MFYLLTWFGDIDMMHAIYPNINRKSKTLIVLQSTFNNQLRSNKVKIQDAFDHLTLSGTLFSETFSWNHKQYDSFFKFGYRLANFHIYGTPYELKTDTYFSSSNTSFILLVIVLLKSKQVLKKSTVSHELVF